MFSEQAPPVNQSIVAGEASELKEVDLSHEEEIGMVGRATEIQIHNEPEEKVGRATEVGNKALESLLEGLRGTDASE